MVYVYEKENIRKLNSHNVLSGGTNITKPIDELQEVYRKARAWDKIVEYKHNIMAVKEIALTHATDEPFNTDMYSVHSLVDNLLDVIDELERD